MWNVLADAVVILHLAFLVFVALGGFLAWRRRWIIPIHIAAVVVGLASITVHFDCPLTTWEQSLRRRAGEHAYTDGFVDHYLKGHVYPHGYDWLVQVVFATCVVVSYVGLFVRDRAHTSRL